MSADAIATLDHSARTIDSSFATVGARMSEGLEITEALASSLDALSVGFAGRLAETRAALEPVSGLLLDFARSLEASRDGLGALARERTRTSVHLQRLRSTTRVVDAAARNARIEIARLGDHARGIDFAEQLETLTGPLATTVERCAALAQRLAELLGSTADAIGRVAAHELPSVTALASDLAAQIDQVEAWQRDSLNAAGSAARQSRSLIDAIGHAMVAVQGGDFARQRIEHCADMLRLTPPASDDVTLGPLICHLAVAHLVATGAQARADIAAVGRMLAGIEADIARTAGVEQILAEADASGQAVVLLSATLDRARTLVATFGAAQGGLGRLTVSLSELVSTFREEATALSSMVRQIILVGMNARLHAHRLGSGGQVVAVIAAEIKALADDVSAGSASILPMLEHMLATVGTLSDANDAHAADIRRLDATVAQATDSLACGQAQLRLGLTDLGRANRSLADMVSTSTARSNDAALIAEIVTELAQDLVATSPPSVAAAEGSRLTAFFDARIWPLYSMEEERRIHRETLSRCGLSVSAERAGSSGEDAMITDDFLL